MKTIAVLAIACLASCATYERKTTYPDGRVVEEKGSGIDPAAGGITGTVVGGVVNATSGK